MKFSMIFFYFIVYVKRAAWLKILKPLKTERR